MGAYHCAVGRWRSRGETLIEGLADDTSELAPEFRAELRATLLGLLDELELKELELEARVEELALVRELLATISYPLIEVREQVLCLPIVGPVDGQMMDTVIDGTLDAVARSGTRWVIVDLTGAQLVDSSAGELLVRLCSSLRLLGAQAMLSGVGPSMAIELVERGQALSLTTHSTLAAALRATEGAAALRATEARRNL